MGNAEQKPKPVLKGMFITKSGAIMTRNLKRAPVSLVMPMNPQDSRFFIKNGELVQPFVKVNFKHVKNIACAGFMLALYEEVSTEEFNPEGMVPVALRSLEVDFVELNEGIDA